VQARREAAKEGRRSVAGVRGVLSYDGRSADFDLALVNAGARPVVVTTYRYCYEVRLRDLRGRGLTDQRGYLARVSVPVPSERDFAVLRPGSRAVVKLRAYSKSGPMPAPPPDAFVAECRADPHAIDPGSLAVIQGRLQGRLQGASGGATFAWMESAPRAYLRPEAIAYPAAGVLLLTAAAFLAGRRRRRGRARGRPRRREGV